MTNTGKVLVTGATGNIGSGLVPALPSAGVEVRALIRDESKAQPLLLPGYCWPPVWSGRMWSNHTEPTAMPATACFRLLGGR